MHILDQYRGTVIACRYCPPAVLADLNTLATLKSTVINALVCVVLDHPHLHVGIIGESTRNPAFVHLDQLDLRNHVEWILCEDFNRFEQANIDHMQLQLDSRFEKLSTQPGWRLIVLHDTNPNVFDILYVWNHPHHDGTGAKIFHRHFLLALDEVSSHSENLIDISLENWTLDLPNDTAKLPPNGELVCPWPLDTIFLLKWFYNDFKPISFFPNSPQATWAPIKCTPYATRFRTITIDTDRVAKIISACRVHNTTITGLIHALVLASLTSSLNPAPGTGFASRTPYDLRRFMPSNPPEYPWLIPKETICNYDSVLDHEFSPKVVAAIREEMGRSTTGTATTLDSDAYVAPDVHDGILEIIWIEAQRVRADITARLASGTRNDLFGVMVYCPNYLIQQQRDTWRTRYLSCIVTNVGVLEEESQKEGGWSLQKAELVLSAQVPCAAFNVSVMTANDKDMCLTCSWQDRVVDHKVGERLLVDLEKWMKDIGAESS